MEQRQGDNRDVNTGRREFLKGMAAVAGGFALTGTTGTALDSAMARWAGAATLPASGRGFAGAEWADQIGLELYTVRDLLAKDYVGTLAKVAQIGYKEVEVATGYGDLPPKQFRAELDRLGLRMPSTHSGIAAGPSAEVEKQLAGFQIMGIGYATLSGPPPARVQGGPRRSGGRAPTPPSRAEQRKQTQQYIRANAQPRTVESVKQEAARYNEYGKIAQRFGIKLLVHNHVFEFVPCQGSAEVPYTILLKETDPELVVFEMDIGWASVAGQDPVQLFQQHPARFVLWHVKDVDGLKCLPPVSDQGARMAEARLVPVGNGDIDYGGIFKHANAAGMKHFYVEQDTAADWGDAIAAARVSYEHLRATLTSPA